MSCASSSRRCTERFASRLSKDARLRAEFQVGVNEPQDFESEIDRAAIIHAACGTHADALAEHGWIAADTTDLGAALETLEGAGNTQNNARAKRKASPPAAAAPPTNSTKSA